MVDDPSRTSDGSAGDADYGTIGRTYASYRQPDQRIFEAILEIFGDARRIVNVGAGTGSYEPIDRDVTPVEPSATMRAQRPAALAAAIDARSEALPFGDDTFDAALASFTVHQWDDLDAGLREMRRVTTGPVVILTCDPHALAGYWLNEYVPEIITTEAGRFPALDRIADALGGRVEVTAVPIPLDCTDGFGEAYYGRPEALLDSGARLANSAWSFVDPSVERRFVERLSEDLADGTWDARWGHLRTQATFDGSLRLLVAKPD